MHDLYQGILEEFVARSSFQDPWLGQGFGIAPGLNWSRATTGAPPNGKISRCTHGLKTSRTVRCKECRKERLRDPSKYRHQSQRNAIEKEVSRLLIQDGLP